MKKLIFIFTLLLSTHAHVYPQLSIQGGMVTQKLLNFGSQSETALDHTYLGGELQDNHFSFGGGFLRNIQKNENFYKTSSSFEYFYLSGTVYSRKMDILNHTYLRYTHMTNNKSDISKNIVEVGIRTSNDIIFIDFGGGFVLGENNPMLRAKLGIILYNKPN